MCVQQCKKQSPRPEKVRGIRVMPLFVILAAGAVGRRTDWGPTSRFSDKEINTSMQELKKLQTQMRVLDAQMPDGIAELYLDIFATQIEILRRLALLKDRPPLSLPMKLRQGRPLLDLNISPFVAGLIKEAAANLVAVANRHAPLLTRITGSPPSSPSGLLREVLDYLDYLNAHYGLVVWRMPAEERKRAAECVETFLGFAALAPVYACCAKSLEEAYNIFAWGEGFCPVCGLLPTMGKLLPEAGTRIAECWLCGAQWVIARLTCPYCGNSNPQQLEVIYLEEKPAVRAYLCLECCRYLKVVDVARKGKDVILALENLASMRLDQIMRNMGYVLGDDSAILPGFPRSLGGGGENGDF